MLVPDISPTRSMAKQAYAMPNALAILASASAFAAAVPDRPTARIIFSSWVYDTIRQAIKCVTVTMNRTGTRSPGELILAYAAKFSKPWRREGGQDGVEMPFLIGSERY